MDNFPEDLPLSNDPQEALRIENQLLQLKLRAELGAHSLSMADIPPDIENEFLKNILAFEQAAARKSKQIKIYELIGQPDFKRSNQLNNENIEAALSDIIDLLSQKSIAIDFLGEYDSRTRYEFITLELFEYETDDTIIPGMVRHFTYEDFHPNHNLDIENRAMEFISAWFKQTLNATNWALGNQFILPNGSLLTKVEVVEKLKALFDLYIGFTNCQYIIKDIAFELNENTGMGYAEGAVKYTALTYARESVLIEGPFKLYFSMEHDWWSIVYFVFPGFEFG
jgi:hypothetical protein